ncbi:MAG: phosphohydrolase [Desulfuromonas sp.]|nr:MAG: phosphohydrolase [Desulfuromonas sp.]
MKKHPAPADIIRKYYARQPVAHEILLDHSRKVTRRALAIGRRLVAAGEAVDLQFLAEAAMLHDIGMIMTDTPDLDCHGDGSYMLHGIKGKELLDQEGLSRHARVCERHIGVGLTAKDIEKQQLPLPFRDMIPETIEEQIISYADLFYSKGSKNRLKEKSPDKIRKKLTSFGSDKVAIFDRWQRHFEPHLS